MADALDMVERVARAIYFRGDDQGDDAWNHCQSWHRTVAREQARAAIEAMSALLNEKGRQLIDVESSSFEDLNIGGSFLSVANGLDAALQKRERG